MGRAGGGWVPGPTVAGGASPTPTAPSSRHMSRTPSNSNVLCKAIKVVVCASTGPRIRSSRFIVSRLSPVCRASSACSSRTKARAARICSPVMNWCKRGPRLRSQAIGVSSDHPWLAPFWATDVRAGSFAVLHAAITVSYDLL